MRKVATQIENPNGLHQRYYIQKIKPNPEAGKSLGFVNGKEKFETDNLYNNVDKEAEYFVMRLDTGGSDIKHITACRIGIHAYADAIYNHLPELSVELKSRYPLL